MKAMLAAILLVGIGASAVVAQSPVNDPSSQPQGKQGQATGTKGGNNSGQ
jgi:hypothetical protein